MTAALSLPRDTIIGRYRIRDRVGGGGNGEVYRAHDDVLARDVAIKILSERAETEAAAVHMLTREARAASALNHPNIVTVYDVGETEAGPFIVMEIVEGRTLRSLLAERPPIAAAITIGMQVARALELAHQAGIIHRDIKPENVMVRSDGVVKVLDFGLARSSSPQRPQEAVTAITTVGTIVGTAAYMSPEQARGEELDPASDIFAFGAVLYELVSHRHPFMGPDTVATLARVLSDTPAPPSQLNRDAPAWLDDLILRMLSKKAQQRPSTPEVLEALARLSGGGAAAAVPAPAPAAPSVVGRDRVLADLSEAFKEAEAGRGGMVALSGEAGVGKTTLVESVLAGLTGRRAPIAIGRGQCSERLSGSEAYLPWLEVLGSLKDEAERPLVESLRVLAPSWHAQIAPLSTGDSAESRLLTVNRGGSQEWLKRELAVFLEETARTRPIVLLLEGVHWADVSTVDLLAYVAGRLASMKVLIIVTYRPSDAKLTLHPFLKLNVDLQSRGVCREIRVDTFSRADVERYLSMRYGAHRFPAAFIDLLHARTEGHPLFVAELLRSLSDRGITKEENGVWSLTRPLSEVAKDIPDTIRRAIELKVERIDEADRKLLVAASVQGLEFDSAIVAEASGMDQGEVEERLERLARLHALVEQVREAEHPDRRLTVVYRFAHVLYQNACYASLGPSRRASLSAAVAKALVTALKDDAPSRASALALLFEAARDFSRSAEFYLLASGRARIIFADREAAWLARKGLEMIDALPKSPELAPRELAHIMALAIPLQSVKSYGAPELGDLYRRARAICDAVGEKLQLYPVLCAISAFHFVRSEMRIAADLIDQVLRLADEVPVPAPRVWAEWGYGAVYGHIGTNLPQAHEHLARGQALYHAGYHPAFMLATGFDPGVGCYFQDARVSWLLGRPDHAVSIAGEAIRLARKLGHPLMIQFSLFFIAWVRQLRREPQLVLEVLREALPAAEERGYAMLVGWMTALGGWAEAMTGNPAAGAAKIGRTLALLREGGAEIMRPSFLALMAEALMLDGRTDEASAALKEARELTAATNERYYEAEVLRLSGELAAKRGRASDAMAFLERAVGVAREQEALSLELRATTSLARQLLAANRRAEAGAALDAVMPRLIEGRDTADARDARELRDTIG